MDLSMSRREGWGACPIKLEIVQLDPDSLCDGHARHNHTELRIGNSNYIQRAQAQEVLSPASFHSAPEADG
jgi:hypothetical protein